MQVEPLRLEDTKMPHSDVSSNERLFWVATGVICTVVAASIWRGYVAPPPTGCYFCVQPTLTHVIVTSVPAGIACLISALFIGIAALSLIQSMRFANLSSYKWSY